MSKSKKSKSSIQCPCCNKFVYKTELEEMIAVLPFRGKLTVGKASMMANFMDVLRSYPSFYQWACDDCIIQKKAIVGNPNQQNFQCGNPFLAYFDKTFTCESCNTSFIFSKEEQKHWYEKLKFIVYSEPKYCQECRKEVREGKNLNTELSNLLKDGKPDDIDSLIRIAEIYKKMEKPEKMKIYLAEVEKLKKRG